VEILERLGGMDKLEAISLLKGSYADFCAAIQSTLDQTHRNEIVPDNPSEEQAMICEKAGELRRIGYTRIESLIRDGEALRIARDFAKSLRHRANMLGVGAAGVFDTELSGLFWRRHESTFNTRVSFNAQNTVAFLQPILGSLGLSDAIINKSIGVTGIDIRAWLLIVDNLQPMHSVDFQWWHFDRLLEQYKVMIFLDDVDDRNGPMRVLPNTHRFEGSRRIYDFCNYSEPLHGADPGYNVFQDRLSEIVSAQGKAGDAFIFDTKLFHAHGRPSHAERNTATIYYQLPATPLNVFYMKYQPEGQTINY
jgi:Phytanoyl-CoA dioxygenase (PhyH)